MRIFTIFALGVITFLNISSLAASVAATTNSYGLTTEQETRYVGAMRDYMLTLNQTCRYTKPEEMSFRLPGDFFELAPSPYLSSYICVVYLKAGN